MAVDVLAENDLYVTHLRTALRDGSSGLGNVPGLLKHVLEGGRWRERRIRTGDVVPFERFEDFVRTAPLEGLGADIALIRRIVADDPVAVDLLDRALQRPHGGDHSKDDIVNLAPKPTGNSEAQAHRRLRSQRPDLHARVLAGELSAHAAMIAAGFRTKSITVPATPTDAARRLARHFTGAALRELIAALETHARD